MILPTCLCCKTQAWLSLLLEVVLGNVLEDPVLTLAKEGRGQEELWQYQDFRLVFNIKQMQFRSSLKKKKSGLSVNVKCANVTGT